MSRAIDKIRVEGSLLPHELAEHHELVVYYPDFPHRDLLPRFPCRFADPIEAKPWLRAKLSHQALLHLQHGSSCNLRWCRTSISSLSSCTRDTVVISSFNSSVAGTRVRATDSSSPRRFGLLHLPPTSAVMCQPAPRHLLRHLHALRLCVVL